MQNGDAGAIAGAYRVTAVIAKFAGDPAPGDEPVETTRAMRWIDAGGAEITDAARIADLEARLAAVQGDAYVAMTSGED
jgi:hypothetical protein